MPTHTSDHKSKISSALFYDAIWLGEGATLEVNDPWYYAAICCLALYYLYQ